MGKKVIIPLIVLLVLSGLLIVADVANLWKFVETYPVAAVNSATTTDQTASDDTSGDSGNADTSGGDNTTSSGQSNSGAGFSLPQIGTVATYVQSYQWLVFVLTLLYSGGLWLFYRSAVKKMRERGLQLAKDKDAVLLYITMPSDNKDNWENWESFWKTIIGNLQATKADRLAGRGSHICFEITGKFEIDPSTGSSNTEIGFYLYIPPVNKDRKGKTTSGRNLNTLTRNLLRGRSRYLTIERYKLNRKREDPLTLLTNPVLPKVRYITTPDHFLRQKLKEQAAATAQANASMPMAVVQYAEYEVKYRRGTDVGGLNLDFIADPLLNIVAQLQAKPQLPLVGIQFIIQPHEGTFIQKHLNRRRRLLDQVANKEIANGAGKAAMRDEQKDLDKRNVTGGGCNLTIRHFACGLPDRVAEYIDSTTGIYQEFAGQGSGAAYIGPRGGKGSRGSDHEVLLFRLPPLTITERSFVTFKELAALAHFPNSNLEVSGIRWAGAMNLEPSNDSVAGYAPSEI